jgi:hypothetical protein
MIKAASRVFETSITAGVGTINLSGPIAGFRSFVSAVGSGSKVSYAIDNGTEWENGIGTVNAGSPDTLSRDNILESSNSGAAVNFGGTLNVRLAPLPAIVMQRDEAKNFTDFKGVSSGTGNAHAVTMPITPIAYTDGMIVMYKAPAANTGSVTINVDSLGAKALKVNGADPISGLIPSGALIVAVYNQANNCFDGINLYKADKAIADLAASLGSAAAEDVGFADGNVVQLGVGGKIPANLLPTSTKNFWFGYRTASVTNSVIAWNSAFDSNGSSYNATNGEFTCPRDGLYMISFTGCTSATGTIQIRKNGTTISTHTSSNGYIPSYTGVIKCVAGDVLTVFTPNTLSVALANSNSCSFLEL